MQKKSCDPQDISGKAFFIGPQAENSQWLESQWRQILSRWLNWRRSLFPQDGIAISLDDKSLPEFKAIEQKQAENLDFLLQRLESEVPKFTPRYIGHMVSEVSIPALLGNIATLLHNPNITTKESATVALDIEQEAIHDLCTLVGYQASSRGHFTSGGTVANIEALWRARHRLDQWLSLALYRKSQGENIDLFKASQCGWEQFENDLKANPQVTLQELKKFSFVTQGPWNFDSAFKGPVVLVPGNKHFSWIKATSLLGLGEHAFWTIALDAEGKLDLTDLKNKVALAKKEARPILCVVSVLGTTELGEVDPIDQVDLYLQELKKTEGLDIWHHIDAAYGGYFCSLIRGSDDEIPISAKLKKALTAVSRTNSLTIDPHKHGFVPFGCGAILVNDYKDYPVSSFSAPYLEKENNPWPFTLEGSRPGTGAVGTWLASKSIGLNTRGYGRILSKGLQAKDHLLQLLLEEIPELKPCLPSDTNILCFCLASPKETLSQVNLKTLQLFQAFKESPNFSVSKTSLHRENYGKLMDRLCQNWQLKQDTDELVLIRTVIMNPFFISREVQIDYARSFVQEVKRLAGYFSSFQ